MKAEYNYNLQMKW